MFWLVSRLVFIVAAFMPAAVFAGYAQLVPPPAFQPVGPGVTTIPATVPANNFIYDVGPARKAVISSAPMQINDYPFDNRAKYRAGFVGTRATLNVGTRTVGVPVALRVAGGAARFAVSAFNPWVAGAQLLLMAIPFIADWLFGSGLEVNDDGVIQVIGTPGTILDPNATRIKDGRTVAEAVAAMANGADIVGYLVSEVPVPCGDGTYAIRISGINVIRNIVNSWCMAVGAVPQFIGTTYDRPATADDLAPLNQVAIDPQALAELDIPLLVEEQPIINPVGLPEGQVEIGDTNPAPELLPRPIRYPNGDPVLIPGTQPPLYTQPWYEITGAPTADNPWRVSIAHVTTTTNDPAPVPDPVPGEDAPPPIPDFYTDCDKYPGVVACAGVGDAPAAEEVPKLNREFLLQAGPSFTGYGCPANLNIGFGGHSFQVVDMAVPCSWIENLVKPIFLLLSFVSAVFIVRSAL